MDSVKEGCPSVLLAAPALLFPDEEIVEKTPANRTCWRPKIFEPRLPPLVLEVVFLSTESASCSPFWLVDDKAGQMQIQGTILTEQGITFAIVLVKPFVIQNSTSAEESRRSFATIAEFSQIPIILAAQDAQGRFTYNGRSDIVNFLANIESSRIPWKTYTIGQSNR